MTGSGKEVTLPPPPPLRTGRESFPSSGSSRFKAPLLRSRFTRRFQSSLATMNAELLEERTILKVGTPARVKRIRFAPGFDVTPDSDFGWVYQLQPERFPAGRPFAGVCREPVPASQWMPVTLDQPSGAFA